MKKEKEKEDRIYNCEEGSEAKRKEAFSFFENQVDTTSLYI